MEFKGGCGIVSAGDHRGINRNIMEFKVIITDAILAANPWINRNIMDFKGIKGRGQIYGKRTN